jgi:hypothetical protein
LNQRLVESRQRIPPHPLLQEVPHRILEAEAAAAKIKRQQR